MFEPLPEDLASALSRAAPRLGGFAHLRFVTETGSTNDEALGLAEAGAPDGTAVMADTQRAGRGRRGRAWFSPPGSGLYLSVVVRVGPAPVTLSLVTLAAGVAAADAITAVSGLPVELKWPNDLVVGRSWRKIGGVLCESVGGGRVKAVVVGIGINRGAEAYPPDLADRTTSIETELGRSVDRAPLVVECLARLADRMGQVRVRDDEGICREWRRLGRGGMGRPVRWHDQGVERTGVARDIDADGALVVESDGRIERLVAGEVQWDRGAHV
jgi:BirA family biotin operon repressor/biotin-[acetyl-CoA-carboxylase] ligase